MKFSRLALLLLALAPIGAAQADIKISAMPPAANLSGNESLAGVQSGANVKITPNQIKAFVNPFTVSPTSTPGSLMKVDNLLELSAFPLANEAGIWSGGTYSYLGISKDFTASTIGSQGGAPLTTLFSFANNNGASGDVVAIIGDATARTSNGTVFGGNLIARNASGLSGTKLVGLEVDVEPAVGTTMGAGSAGYYANIFNIASSTPVFQAGALGGGTWGNGFITSHITGTHYSVLAGDPTTSVSFIDTQNGTFSGTAIKLGKGASQAVDFGGGSWGTSPFLYSNTSNDLLLNTGSTDYFRIADHTGATGIEFLAAQKKVKSQSATFGANDAFRGRGVFQIGGAGAKDGGNGTYLADDGHANWAVVESSIPFNPTELNIYGNGTGGVAVSDGSATVTRSTGAAWTSAMVGGTFWMDATPYTVASVPDSSHVTLATAPPAATAIWHYQSTTGSGTGVLAGGVFTRTSGDPFIPNTFGSGFALKLNGTTYGATFTDSDTYTITAAPANGTYSYSYATNINNQVATLRIQLTAGTDEENLATYATPTGYFIDSQLSGFGKRKDLFITSEGQPVMDFAPVGKFVSIGGTQNAEAMRFIYAANNVNRTEAFGAPTGVTPGLRARGADANVNMGFDTAGTGSFIFTSGAFGRTNFKVFGSSGTDYLTVDAGTGTVPFAAAGGSTNIDIKLFPKGTGKVVAQTTLTVNGGAITMPEVASASVGTPAANSQTLFFDSADHKLKRKDSTGTVTIIN